ncbi:hypothetical protein DD598_30455, partial [Enterobacter cloacae complex sp. 2DZ2F16B1]
NSLEDYNLHSLMWSKNLKQRRGQGGLACMVKKGLEDFVSIVKDDKYKRYVWLKIMTPKRAPIFVAGCYIPHHDSPFYACMDRDQPFFDLEENISYFKGEVDVIVFGDMNARTKTLQHDTQQFDMPYISKDLEEVHLYDHLQWMRKSQITMESYFYTCVIARVCSLPMVCLCGVEPMDLHVGDIMGTL